MAALGGTLGGIKCGRELADLFLKTAHISVDEESVDIDSVHPSGRAYKWVMSAKEKEKGGGGAAEKAHYGLHYLLRSESTPRHILALIDTFDIAIYT